MNKESKILGAIAIATLWVAGCSSNATSTEAATTGNPTSAGTSSLPSTEIPASIPTTLTPPSTETLPPTLTPTPTFTPFPFEKEYITDYLAYVNDLANESTGESFTTSSTFEKYWMRRVVAGEEAIKYDRMFAQLSLPVNPDYFKQRDLNHDWLNYGMGFSEVNLPVGENSVLVVKEEKDALGELKKVADADGYYRGWALTNARDLDKAVKAAVDEFVKINPSFAGKEQDLFDQIIFSDFWIKAADDLDNDPFTFNDKFTTCETYSGKADTRSNQPELAREMQFNPEQEKLNNNQEEETKNQHDSDNSILVAMVTNGWELWVEARDLANPPDPFLNDLSNESYDGKNPTRAHGGRLVPCGVGAARPTATPTKMKERFPRSTGTPTSKPTFTPKPSKTPTLRPSSTPQNPEPTATRGPLPGGTPTQPVPTGSTPETPVPTPTQNPYTPTPSL